MLPLLFSFVQFSALDMLITATFVSILTFVIAYLIFRQRPAQKKDMNIMKALIETREQYIMFIDEKNNVILANEEFEQLANGDSPLTGMQLNDLEIATDIKTALLRDNELLEQGETSGLRFTHQITLNGEAHWLDVHKQHMKLENPSQNYILITATDVSDKLTIEQELTETQSEYKLLVEAAQDMVIRTDTEGHIEYVNDIINESLGFEPVSVKGKFLHDILHLEDRILLRKHFSDLQKDKLSVLYNDIRLVHKNGDIRWFGLKSSPVFSENDLVGVLSVARDITEYKEVELKLKQAKKAAEDANRAKSDFIASMSHEFKTPLNAILGFSEILKGNMKSDHSSSEFVDQIEKAGKKLLNLIEDILQVSGAEGSTKKLHHSEIRPGDLLRELKDQFTLHTPKSDLKINVKGGSSEYHIVSDHQVLRTILENVIENAIKFTETGRIDISYDLQLLSDDQAVCRFEVADTGIGIDPDQTESVFEPFWQKDPVKYEGTGLGLTITKRLVEMLGGDIKITNRKTGGTLLSISMPVTAKQQAYSSGEIHSEVSNEMVEKGTRVLVVDDVPANRTLCRILLDRNGFDYREAQDGEQALEIAHDYLPDLILSDLNMPVMDGFEFVERLRHSKSSLSETPVIAITGDHSIAKTEDLMVRGFNALILKPFKEDQLISTMQNVLSFPSKRFNRNTENVKTEYREVVDFINSLTEKQFLIIYKILKFQDMEALSSLRQELDLNQRSTNPIIERLEESGRNYDYLFITKVLKMLDASERLSPVA